MLLWCHCFALGPSACETSCAPSRSGVSPSPVECLHSCPLAFKDKYSGGFSSQHHVPRLGSLTWGSKLSLLWESLCDVIIFQFVGNRYGTWLHHENIPPWWLIWSRIYLHCERPGFDPWVGQIPWRRAWQPTPVFLPGESPWTEDPGGLQSTASQRAEHDRATHQQHIILLWLLFVFWWSIFFGRFESFLSVVIQKLVVISVFSW